MLSADPGDPGSVNALASSVGVYDGLEFQGTGAIG